MSNTLTTVATYRDLVEASMARNLVQAAGIRAFLADEETVGMAWHLSNALGGVKLQVWTNDVQAAVDILESHSRGDLLDTAEADADSSEGEADDLAGPVDQDAQADDVDDDEADVPEALTMREQNADRAWRAALIGLLALPLEIYAFWLVLDVVCSEERLRPIHRRRATLAALISLPLIAVFCMVLGSSFFR